MTDESQPRFEFPEEFNQEVRAGFEQFFERMRSRNVPHPEVGKILTCHLLLQHQLIEHIEELNPKLGSIFGLGRLPPIEMLLVLAAGPSDRRNPIIELLRPGILEINDLRNKISHKLEWTITKDRVKNVYVTLRHAFSDRAKDMEEKPPVEAVQSFTVFACLGMRIWQTMERYIERLKERTRERAEKLEPLMQRLLELLDSTP